MLKYYPDPVSPAKQVLASTNSAADKTSSLNQQIGTIEFHQPEAAEIYVDGKFVGDIPSSLPLAAGNTYVIPVKASGREDWTRKITIFPGMHTLLSPWAE